MKWNRRYLDLAKLVSTWSKDPTTQVGCCITLDNYVKGLGFNGFPRCIEDTDERLLDRAIKHKLTLHAEMNALAASKGEGDTIYIYPCLPCTTCIKLIMQTNIRKIVVGDQEIDKIWNTDFVVEMAEEANIEIIYMSV